MADIKRFSNKSQIENGTQDVNLSLNDILISQHITGDNNDYKLTLAQAQAVPYGVCNSPANEDKTVVFSNYPDGFTAQVGTKILVKFTYGNTKGSVSAGTYPKLTAGGLTGAILAQGKTIANGAIVAGQICELIATPDGWNIDQNTREVTTDYTILSDGKIKQWGTIDVTTAEYNFTVNFYIPFSTITNIQVTTITNNFAPSVASVTQNIGGSLETSGTITKLTNSSFCIGVISPRSAYGNGGKIWYAEGYI